MGTEKVVGGQGRWVNTQVTFIQWATLQASTTFSIWRVPSALPRGHREPGKWAAAGWGGSEPSWQPKQSMRLVGENVPGEENWQRKERLKKAHKLHSENAAHPSKHATVCSQMSPLRYSSPASVLKLAHAWESPGNLAKMQIQRLGIRGAWDSASLLSSHLRDADTWSTEHTSSSHYWIGS